MAPSCEFERLFLLEFFIDNIKFNCASSDSGQLCVSFQFLHYPRMTVCEEDFSAKTKSLNECSTVNFKSGKSCLFSLRSKESPIAPTNFDVIVNIHQRINNERSLLGKANISLGDSFTNLMNNNNHSNRSSGEDSQTPKASVKHDMYPVIDDNGKEIGSIMAFVRLSCFGKLIVTQFQLAGEEENKSYMFKGTDNKSVYKDQEEVCGEGGGSGMERGGGEERESGQDWAGKEEGEGEIPGGTPYDQVFGYPTESEEMLKKDEPCPTIQGEGGEQEKDEEGEEEEAYKEIGAEINGHSLTIRVLKKKKRRKPKKGEGEGTTRMEGECSPCTCSMGATPPALGPPCPYAPKLNVCDCDYPLPPELIPRCPPQPPGGCCSCCCPPPSQMGGIPNQQQCPKEDCPLGLNVSGVPELEPGTLALKGDQVIYQMASRQAGEAISEKERKLANSIYYKMNTSEGGREGCKNVFQVTAQNPGEPLNCGPIPTIPQQCGLGCGPVSGLPLDKGQDVFLLKMQQGCEGADVKNKLEMELRTPKPKEPKPDSDCKNTQCELACAADAPARDNKKKKKK